MRKSVRIFWTIFFTSLVAVNLFLLAINWGVFGKMPSLKDLENPSILQASELYAIDGTLMGKYYLPDGNRSIVQYKDISKYLVNGLIATEDKRYFDHSGIDMKGTMRAVFLLGSQGGGSTITQQLALALFNERAKNKARRVMQKLKEWIIAIKLERNFTKEEIIALYLNAVPFSQNVFGIRNASLTFFQKEPDRLTVDEAALLIGMINGPGLYNPLRNPKPALDRRNLVITRVEEAQFLTPDQANSFRAKPIKLDYKKLDQNTGYAPYFREVLRDDIKAELKKLKKPNGDSYNIYDDGLKIYTTINPTMQEYAEEAVANHMAGLQRSANSRGNFRNGSIWNKHENILEAAMKQSDRWKYLEQEGLSEKEIRATFKQKTPMTIFSWNKKREKDTVMTPMDSIKYHKQMEQTSFMVMDPTTGEVKAWVGGINFKTFKYDHVNLKTQRQVGSTIKPLLYAQAMEERGFTPETVCQNSVQNFPGFGIVPARGRCPGGSISMANALAHSQNCASAYIMKNVGPAQFVGFLERLNIPTKVKPYPSIALGACDLSLFEMLWGYTIFAGRGFTTKPYMITRIEDRNGNVIKRFDFTTNRKEAISEITAYTMAKMMQGTVDFGTARGLRAEIGAKEMGGKTGTTNDNADAWFIGYTPQLLAGAWVGFDDRFIKNTGDGNRIASPIFRAFFKKAMADKTLGLDKDATFTEPATMDIESGNAEITISVTNPTPGAQGVDQGVGTQEDYMLEEEDYDLGPESNPVQDDKPKPIKKDTAKAPADLPKASTDPKLGDEKKQPEKKNFIKNLFKKKEKKNEN